MITDTQSAFDTTQTMKKTDKLDIITIVAVGFLAFGLQIPWLGFFQDDWNFVYYSSARGMQGLFQFLIIDGRPGATWVYTLGFSTLGYNPALWQFFSISLRILTAITFLLIIKKLWPNRRYGNLITCIIFLTYPFFTIQPLSVAYAPHFMSYLLYALSILLMIKAFENPEKYLGYSIPAVLLTFLQLFTVEYFVGLELLRPIILWFLISRNKMEKPNIRRILGAWLPYLIILVFFIIWRGVFSANLGIRNNPIASLSSAQNIIGSVAKNITSDFVLILISSWFKLINPDLFVIGPVRNFYVLASSLIGGFCFYFLAKPVTKQADNNSTGVVSILLAGGFVYMAGMAATYAVGFIVHLKIAPWNGRFALPALLGLALIVSGLIELLITNNNIRHVFYACLIGLLIGSHNYNTLIFKSAWEKQERFYEQLTWRAPFINPGTAIIADEEILGFMGDYPTSLAINSIYNPQPSFEVPYWFFAISENFNFSLDEITRQDQLANTRDALAFHGKSNDAIYITYEPENGQCLWVLRPEDGDYKYLPSNMKKAASISNISNIHGQGNTSPLFSQSLGENKNTWCYYYQKADLARQMNDWETVITLWNNAQEKNLRPYNGFEYIPFIEAYAYSGKWNEALQLTDKANKITSAMYFILCPTWEQLDNTTPLNKNKEQFVNNAYQILKCAK